jgi:hypothetical protein
LLFQLSQCLQAISSTKEAYPDLKLDVSVEAGLYLCEFTYFLSLELGRAPTVFLHVPPFDSPYNPEQLRAFVSTLLTQLAKQVTVVDRPVPSSRPKVADFESDLQWSSRW